MEQSVLKKQKQPLHRTIFAITLSSTVFAIALCTEQYMFTIFLCSGGGGGGP